MHFINKFLKSGPRLRGAIQSCLPHVDDAADAVASLHVAKGLVDLVEGLTVGDELVDLELSVHVVVDEVGELGAALDTAKGATLPDTSGDKLECCIKVSQRYETRGKSNVRRVEISWPAAATPMTIDSPQPLWQASRAERMTWTLPVQSKV